MLTSDEISALAKTHAEAIFTHNLTKAEVVMLLAVITARVNQNLLGNNTTNQVLKTEPTAKPLGAVIAPKGYPCVCVACSKKIYVVNKDVHENEKVGDFIDSYTPMPGYPPITRQTKISNIENNITIDCPDKECSGELSLYLAGKQTS